jgi:uncharacterized protein (DUF58 family)
MAKSLNLDIAKSVAEFEALISKIIPKRIFYRMLLRGKGFEFEGYRNFSPDDDASLIDWKASLRAQGLLTRQYVEEKDNKIMFVVDVGDNMIFGSQEKLKCEYCAELCAALSHVVLNAGDHVGFTFIGNKPERTTMPASGKKQFDIFVYNLSDAELYGGNSDMGKNMNAVMEMLNPSITLVILISDFIRFNEEHYKRFEELGALFETAAIIIKDPLDFTLPDMNQEVIIEDAETGEKMFVNPSIAKKVYEDNAEKNTQKVRDLFFKSRIDFIELNIKEDFYSDLAHFLKRRLERRY